MTNFSNNFWGIPSLCGISITLNSGRIMSCTKWVSFLSFSSIGFFLFGSLCSPFWGSDCWFNFRCGGSTFHGSINCCNSFWINLRFWSNSINYWSCSFFNKVFVIHHISCCLICRWFSFSSLLGWNSLSFGVCSSSSYIFNFYLLLLFDFNFRGLDWLLLFNYNLWCLLFNFSFSRLNNRASFYLSLSNLRCFRLLSCFVSWSNSWKSHFSNALKFRFWFNFWILLFSDKYWVFNIGWWFFISMCHFIKS